MSEEKKLRSMEEIQTEFGTLCTKAGHLQYQISVFKEDLALLNAQIKELNFEAAKVKAAEGK